MAGASIEEYGLGCSREGIVPAVVSLQKACNRGKHMRSGTNYVDTGIFCSHGFRATYSLIAAHAITLKELSANCHTKLLSTVILIMSGPVWTAVV